MNNLNIRKTHMGQGACASFRSSFKGPLIILWALLAQASFAQPAGYNYGKLITIDATEVSGTSSLTDFPVVVRFMGANADADLQTTTNGGHIENANGYDIIFTADQAGTTVLDHQIEYFDGTTGEYVAWVRIPTLSNSADTEFYMYYGNCAVSADPSTTNVWNADYDAVYFLHDDFNDYTANGNNGTNTGSTDASPALIGDGQTFGVTDYVEIPTSSISLAQGTVSIWAYSDGFGGVQYIYGHTSDPNGWVDRLQLYVDDGIGGLDLGMGNNHNLQQGIVTLNTGEWYHIALTWDGSDCYVYVNGVLEHTEGYNNFGTLETYMDIGNDGRLNNARDEGWGGDLDHAHLSNEVFSAEWIQTEYNNQREGSTFLSASAELTARTFYSFASGNWDDNTSWSFTSDGSSGAVGAGIWPGRNDNVVIQNTHTITIDATDDNNSCGISADNLGRANVGNGGDPFIGSGVANFYQTGDILISNGGTLNASQPVMVEGYTYIEDGGAFSTTTDFINLGYLEMSTTASFDTDDDLILTGNSVTIMNNTSGGADDLYIEWTDATLCGDGNYNVGNGGGTPTIQYFNGATDAQICAAFTVTCASTCTGVPASGTGTFISGNTGLGGVGDSDNLQLWLRADDLSLADGSPVTSWDDVSGNSLTANADGGAGTEPTFNANTVNTSLPSISFDGGDYLNLGQPAGLDFVPGTDSWSFFIVYNVPTPSAQGTFFAKADAVNGDRTYQYTIDDTGAPDSYFTSFIGGSFQDGSVTANTGNWVVSSHSNNTADRSSWTNEGADITGVAIGTNTTGAVDVLIGARRQTAPSTGAGFLLTGSIAEIAMYDGEMTEAQRIIITNYLAAKYAISLTANDVYTEDDNGFDFEVIGIGQASDGTNHLDSRGPGVARIWNPSDPDNGEYLMVGHDNTAITAVTSDPGEVDGTVIQQRLSRIWAVSEAGDLGAITVSIDFSGVGGNPLGSNLRLLIDRDGDFSTNDVTPIEGSVSNDIAVFSNVDFQDGDQFTLGNTDVSQPLPIELTAFSARPAGQQIVIEWKTASETNNDYFTIERSWDGVSWRELEEVPGAGNSKQTLSYKRFDGHPLVGGSYYRLKQTDFDGQFSYSDIVFVWFDQGVRNFEVSPNPSQGQFYVEADVDLNATSAILYTLAGRVVHGRVKLEGPRLLMVDLSGEPRGIYLLKVVVGDQTLSVSRLNKE